MGASVALQAAFYAAISGLGLTVYADRPQAKDGGDPAVYPHVQIGLIVLAPFDTATETGFDFVVRLHTRGRGGSALPVKSLQDELYARLHRGALQIDGHSLILMDRLTSDLTRLEDGTFHGVCEYRGLIRPT